MAVRVTVQAIDIAMFPSNLHLKSFRIHSLVRPGPRAFFHPDRQISQPPRAGAVKAGRVFRRLSRPPVGLGLDWPEHGGMVDRIGVGGCGNLRWDAGMLVILVLAGRPTPATPRQRTSIRNAGTAPYRTDFLPTNSREEPVYGTGGLRIWGFVTLTAANGGPKQSRAVSSTQK